MIRAVVAVSVIAASGVYALALGRIPRMREHMLRYWTGGLAVTLAAIVLAGVIS